MAIEKNQLEKYQYHRYPWTADLIDPRDVFVECGLHRKFNHYLEGGYVARVTSPFKARYVHEILENVHVPSIFPTIGQIIGGADKWFPRSWSCEYRITHGGEGAGLLFQAITTRGPGFDSEGNYVEDVGYSKILCLDENERDDLCERLRTSNPDDVLGLITPYAERFDRFYETFRSVALTEGWISEERL